MQVILKPNKLRALLGGHPWVMDTSLAPLTESIPNGSVVDVYTEKGRFFARGLYNGHSKIRVRLYSWDQNESLDAAFWTEKIQTALDLRYAIGYFNRNAQTDNLSTPTAVRLINSEGDGLSGLIADMYSDIIIVQATALGIWQRAEMLADILRNLTSAKTVIVRTESSMAKREGLEESDSQAMVFGSPAPETCVINSGGILYQIDFSAGQKTGFYLDQRENRNAAAVLTAGKSVLDMFCYHGGFSLAAAKAGAKSCLACDSSAKALEQTLRNVQLNGVNNIEVRQGDSFEILESFKAQGQVFGAVILDPPKFAQGKKSVQEALRGYHYLNKLGIACVEKGGILVTCSCTGSVTREDFFSMLHGAASQAGRSVQILQQRGAAMDHPVLDACPESDYLKCFLCRVI